MANEMVGDNRTSVPLIAHIEVGGSTGGSVLQLQRYLQHCDRQRFRHEVIFYRRPPDSEAQFQEYCPVVDCGFPMPSQSSSLRGQVPRRIRGLLSKVPRMHTAMVTVRGGLACLLRLPQVIELVKLFRQRDYALLHCNNSFSYQPLTILAAWLAKKPVVSHFRTIRPLNPWEMSLAHVLQAIIAINDAVAENLKQQGIRAPIFVQQDVFDEPTVPQESKSRLRKELLRDGAVLVGTVSRLEEGKGIEDFLAAVRCLTPCWPDVRYVIVGDGSRAPALKKITAEWGLNDRVHFTGFQSKVFEYYAAMDVFVCASHAEGGPATVIEAMQMGLPVVTTRVGLVPQLIRDGVNGLVVDVSDVRGLRAAIGSLLAEPTLREEVGARAAVSLRDLADPRRQARKMDDFFACMLAHNCSGATEARAVLGTD